MKYLIIGLGAIGILILVLMIGVLLPQKRKVEKITYFQYSPEQIFEVVSDLKGQEEWREGLDTVIIHQNNENREEWTEVPKKGQSLRFKTEEKKPPRLWKFSFQSKGIEGYWEGVYQKEGNKTRVKHIEALYINNPFIRVLSYLFFDPEEFMNSYLKQLADRLDEKFE